MLGVRDWEISILEVIDELAIAKLEGRSAHFRYILPAILDSIQVAFEVLEQSGLPIDLLAIGVLCGILKSIASAVE